MTGTPSPSASLSTGASPSGTPAASTTPSATPAGAYASSTPVLPGVTLAWRLNNADPHAATSVDFQLTAVGKVWLGMARSWNGTMLEGFGRNGSGPAVIGRPDQGFSVWQYELTSKAANAGGIIPLPANKLTTSNTYMRYDAGSDSTVMGWTRALMPPDYALDSEKGIDPTEVQTYIVARGADGGAFAGHGRNRTAFSLRLSPAACTRAASCGGHGTCAGTLQSPLCFCDVGYAGANCGMCASGFAAVAGSASGACAQARSPADDVLQASTSVLLNPLDFGSAVGVAGTVRYRRFMAQVRQDIASALQTDVLRVNVTSACASSPSTAMAMANSNAAAAGRRAQAGTNVLPGSGSGAAAAPLTGVLLSFSLLPSTVLSGTPSAPANDNTQPPASSLAYQFARLAGNPSSALYSASTYMQYTAPAALPLTFAFGAAAVPVPVYSYSAALEPANLTLSWTVDTAAGTVAFRLSQARGSPASGAASATGAGVTPTWIALAFNNATGVAGSDAVVYQPAAGSITQYYVASHSLAGMQAVPMGAGNAVLFAAEGSSAGNTAFVQWTRPLAAGAYTGAQALSLTAPTLIYYAVGNGALLSQAGGNHSSALVGGVTVNFGSGGVAPIPSGPTPPGPGPAPGMSEGARIAHGVLMFIAWGLLIPAGIIVNARMRAGRREVANTVEVAQIGEFGTPRKGGETTAAKAQRAVAQKVQTSFAVKPLWLRLHVGLQMAGTLVSFIAFVIALAMVPAGLRMTKGHHVLGVIVWVLGTVQMIAGLLRPPPHGAAKKNHWRTAFENLHRANGYLVMTLAVVQIYLGLAAISAHAVFYVLYSGVLALTIALLVRDSLAKAVIARLSCCRCRGVATKQMVRPSVVAVANPTARVAALSLRSSPEGSPSAADGSSRAVVVTLDDPSDATAAAAAASPTSPESSRSGRGSRTTRVALAALGTPKRGSGADAGLAAPAASNERAAKNPMAAAAAAAAAASAGDGGDGVELSSITPLPGSARRFGGRGDEDEDGDGVGMLPGGKGGPATAAASRAVRPEARGSVVFAGGERMAPSKVVNPLKKLAATAPPSAVPAPYASASRSEEEEGEGEPHDEEEEEGDIKVRK